MVTSFDDIVTVIPSRVNVGVGATIATYMDVVPGQKNITIKYISGGTLEILGVTYGSFGGTFFAGSTLSAQALANANGTGWIVQSEILSFDGPCRFYLSSTGATSIVHVIRAVSATGA